MARRARRFSTEALAEAGSQPSVADGLDLAAFDRIGVAAGDSPGLFAAAYDDSQGFADSQVGHVPYDDSLGFADSQVGQDNPYDDSQVVDQPADLLDDSLGVADSQIADSHPPIAESQASIVVGSQSDDAADASFFAEFADDIVTYKHQVDDVLVVVGVWMKKLSDIENPHYAATLMEDVETLATKAAVLASNITAVLSGPAPEDALEPRAIIDQAKELVKSLEEIRPHTKFLNANFENPLKRHPSDGEEPVKKVKVG